jgi:hypothetical protein
MDTFTEKARPLAFVLHEANGLLSRDVLTIASGAGKLEAGTILGKLAVGAATSAGKSGGNTGNGTLTLDATTPELTGVKVGVYTVRCIAAATNSGTFLVLDPDGNSLGQVLVGATFANDLKFVIADGSTDFVVGDGFDITVAAGSGKHIPSLNAITAGKVGAEIAVAILGYGVDATSADVDAVCVTNDAEVKKPMLLVDVTVDDSTKRNAKIAQLRAVNIKAR